MHATRIFLAKTLLYSACFPLKPLLGNFLFLKAPTPYFRSTLLTKPTIIMDFPAKTSSCVLRVQGSRQNATLPLLYQHLSLLLVPRHFYLKTWGESSRGKNGRKKRKKPWINLLDLFIIKIYALMVNLIFIGDRCLEGFNSNPYGELGSFRYSPLIINFWNLEHIRLPVTNKRRKLSLVKGVQCGLWSNLQSCFVPIPSLSLYSRDLSVAWKQHLSNFNIYKVFCNIYQFLA